MHRRHFLAATAASLLPLHAARGWRPLLNGQDLTGWTSDDGKPTGWVTVTAVSLEPQQPRRLALTPGAGGMIANSLAGKTNNLVTVEHHGDVELEVEFLISQGSNSGIYFQGLYEVQIFDSYGKAEPLQTSDGGAIYHRWIDGKPVGGSAPRKNACRAPGEWQRYEIRFRAPRFDAQGRKTANARFERVVFNGVLVQEGVEVPGGTRSHLNVAEAPLNPLMLQGDHGPVAYRSLRWREI